MRYHFFTFLVIWMSVLSWCVPSCRTDEEFQMMDAKLQDVSKNHQELMINFEQCRADVISLKSQITQPELSIDESESELQDEAVVAGELDELEAELDVQVIEKRDDNSAALTALQGQLQDMRSAHNQLQSKAEEMNKKLFPVVNADKEFKFESCNKLSAYASYPWFEGFSSYADLKWVKFDTANDNACFSNNGNIMIVWVPWEGCRAGDYYRYDITSAILQKSDENFSEIGCLAPVRVFWKRVWNVIALEWNDKKDACDRIMDYEYDFMSNVITLKKEKKVCNWEESLKEY